MQRGGKGSRAKSMYNVIVNPLSGGGKRKKLIARVEELFRRSGRDFRIFFSVIMPQLQPVIASVLILTGIKIWNDYKYALYFLQDNDMETITLFISKFFSDFSVELNEAAAAAFLAIVPVCAVFLFLQKYFISGLSEGSVK